MTNMKKYLFAGLFIFSVCVMRAEAGTYYTSRSTGVLLSSGIPFNVTAIGLSTPAVNTPNTNYVVFYDTDGYQGWGLVGQIIGCTTIFAESKRIAPPLFFASSITLSSNFPDEA